jgi:hypothetical protein
MIKKIQPQSFLSLGLEHYLTPRVLTTCALKVARSSGLRANKNASWKPVLPLGFVHSRILPLSFRPERSALEGAEAQWRNLFILLTSAKLSARPLFCHLDRSEAEWKNLFILLASVKLSARPLFCHFDRSEAE